MKSRTIFLFLLVAVFLALIAIQASAQSCGNGQCETGENSCSCAKDCGKCEGPVSGQTCKAYACVEAQCTIYTVAGCCGNYVCEANESYGNCPVDCLPTSISIKVIGPEENTFFRGEKFQLKVEVTADERPIISAKINAKGFFGETELINDGKHDDGSGSDNKYANTLEIPSTIDAGSYDIFIKGEFMKVDGNTDFQIDVNPKLDVETDAEGSYRLGDLVEFAGTVTKKNSGVQMPLKIVLSTGSKTVDEYETDSDINGNFSYAFHSSLADLSGNWKIKISGSDDFNNFSDFEQPFLMTRPQKIDPLNIEVINDFRKEYNKLESVEFIVKVIDDQFNIVKDANLTVELPGNKIANLHELEPGKYLGSVLIERQIPAGEQEFKIAVSIEKNGSVVQGEKKIKLKINPIQLNLKIISPKKLSYEAGEEMELKVELTDSEGKEVNDAVVKAKIGEQEIELKLFEIGTYKAVYATKESERGKLKIFFSADDGFGDMSLAEREVEVAGKNLIFSLLQNIIALGILAVLGIVAAALIFFIFLRKSSIKSLQDKLNELERFEKKAQEMYFHGSEISKEEYNKLMEKYENERKDVKMRLNQEMAKK